MGFERASFLPPGLSGWLTRYPLPHLVTNNLRLRPPRGSDHPEWARLRRENYGYLQPWEPAWNPDHLSPNAFRRRVSWARREIAAGRTVPLLVFHRDTGAMIGGVTIEHVRRGAAQSGALGYWLAEPFSGRGYMTEALQETIAYAFGPLGLSRLEAACLPYNAASHRLLLRCGFHQEARLAAYLQIDGEWRDHLFFFAVEAVFAGWLIGANWPAGLALL
ncbi:MAG: GNAT family protein [Pseudomonadota bacterium]